MSLIRNRPVNWILLSASIAFVILFCIRNFNQLSEYDYSPDIALIAFSVASALAGLMASSLIWYRIVRAFGMEIRYVPLIRVWLLSRFGRYVPGKFPFLLLRINLTKEYPAETVTQATVCEHFVAVGGAITVVLASTAFLPDFQYRPYVWLLGGTFLCAFILQPSWIGRILNLIFRLFGRNPIEQFPPDRIIRSMVLLGIVPILIHGLALFLLFSSLEPIPLSLYPAITGTYYMSSLIGLIAFFAPGGIGVREGLMMLVFSQFLSVPSVVIASVSIRLVMILSECLLLGVFSLLSSTSGRQAEND